MTMTSAEIRQTFLEFFEEHQHTVVASSALIPAGDPTLLFTNAGMVQFKDVFLGLEKRDYVRATTSQKCMRVSGKHNDLENVGPSLRHHTFFEMLGNFSFGDYFKHEAIRYAYDCLTGAYGLDPDRLYYTVFLDDDEAFNIWTDEIGVEPERVYRMGEETNFWQMADVGPCGPTSEIHYDWGPEHCTCGLDDCSVLLDNGCLRWLEIWNLVFMQFNQTADGARAPLPKPGVDTGMGLERIVSVVQGKMSNYDTDLFTPVMARTQALLGHSDGQREEYAVPYRVIADHGRAITFMIGDGVMPGNSGREAVLRLILRRAARYGRLAGFTEPFLAQIADTVIDEMGGHYLELKTRRQFILNVITQEEERFLRTYENGLKLLADLVEDLRAGNKHAIPGAEVFKLHATYGFPKDLTRIIAEEEYGFAIDEAGFQAAMEEHGKISGSGAFGEIGETELGLYAGLLDRLKLEGQLPSDGVAYDPYSGAEMETTLIAALRDGAAVDSAGEGQQVELVLAATNFYVESGGQISDTGRIVSGHPGNGASAWEFEVEDTRRPVQGLVVHYGRVRRGAARVGDGVRALPDRDRRWSIMRNHTATHLLHAALRQVLGEHVAQAGSLVAPDRLRFDFSHPQMVEAEQLGQIERQVNEAILAGYPVQASYRNYRQAVAAGAIALFGEKYGDTVRVLKIGDDSHRVSMELCGGTHVQNTSQIGFFHIVSEGSVAAGVRRIEAVTGRGAYELVQRRLGALYGAAARLGVAPEEVEPKVLAVQSQVQALEKQNKEYQRRLARMQMEGLLGQTRRVDGVPVLAARVDSPDAALLREMSDWFRDRLGSGVVVLGAVINDKPSFVAAVTPDLIEKGLHAGKLVKGVAQVVGGGGGGRPNLAQAGGKDAGRLAEALARVDTLVGELLETAGS
ncbi:MAG: alanine--tRNA ligase [Anaerolineae bacterium]